MHRDFFKYRNGGKGNSVANKQQRIQVQFDKRLPGIIPASGDDAAVKKDFSRSSSYDRTSLTSMIKDNITEKKGDRKHFPDRDQHQIGSYKIKLNDLVNFTSEHRDSFDLGKS